MLQRYNSKDTSINKNKLPRTFKYLEKKDLIKPNQVILDLGGGKYDNAIEWASKRSCKLYIIDPFNRSEEYNQRSLEETSNGRSDIVTINNVLNVIQEESIREHLLRTAYESLKDSGKLFVLIYEGNKSGIGKETQKGQSWQNNKRTSEYLSEVLKVFGNGSIKGSLIEATKCRR